MADHSCIHCGGSQYVFIYPVEKALKEQGINIYDIPPIAFAKIPYELFRYCHCTVGMLYFRQWQEKPCEECDDTTWLFSEEAHIKGYGWRKVSTLSPQELRELPCAYFERCSCIVPPTKKKLTEDQLSNLLTSLRNLLNISPT